MANKISTSLTPGVIFSLVSMICTISSFVFIAGKLAQSLNNNTIAIQRNTLSIQKTEADVVELKEFKAEAKTELRNICENLTEIKLDIKTLLKNK